MRKLLSLLLTLLSVSLLLFPTLAQEDDSANLLTNPGFEEPYVEQEGILPRQVAEGWTAWNLPPENTQPEYAPSSATNADRVREGDEAQRYFSFFSPHVAGLYQVVSGLTAGEEVNFSIYAYTFSSNDAEAVDESEDPCGITVEVGIDPTGGEDSESAAIVWSDAVEDCDAYNLYSISAVPEGDTVTVYVRTNASVGRLTSEVYLDEASLTVGSVAGVTDDATDEVVIGDGIIVLEDATATDDPVMTEEIVVTGDFAAPTDVVDMTEEIVPTLEIVTAQVTEELIATEALTLEPVDTLEIPVITEETIVEFLTEEATTDTGVIASATVSVIETATSESPTDFPTVTPVEEIVPTATSIPPTPIPVTPTDDAQATQTTEAVLEDLIDEYPGRVEHTVRLGESVYIIANLYGSSVPVIIEANGLNENALIFVGQRLVIPVRVPPASTAIAATDAATSVPTTSIPPTPTSTIAPSPEDGSVYIVRRGDTLSQIARRFNTTVATLAQLNGIVNVNSILVGQRLTLPTGSDEMTPTAAPLTPTPVGETIRYVVLPGDSLYRLSLIYKVSIQRIAEANEIANINRIFVGQVLDIPQPAQ